MPSIPRGRLLVSIHDVTPALAAPVRALWDLCAQHDCTPALLVVPNWHGAWPLEDHPEFMDWVRGCADAGAEIILHGERHDEVGLERGVTDTWRAFGRTAREGEFLTLPHDAARERIDRGLVCLTQQRLQPVGFIPPAWLAREATHHAVREAGLAFSEDATGVRLHRTSDCDDTRVGIPHSRRIAVPALRWSGRTTMRAVASRVVADVRWVTWRHRSLVRLALHPQDLSNPITAQSVHTAVARWTQSHTAQRYGDL